MPFFATQKDTPSPFPLLTMGDFGGGLAATSWGRKSWNKARGSGFTFQSSGCRAEKFWICPQETPLKSTDLLESPPVGSSQEARRPASMKEGTSWCLKISCSCRQSTHACVAVEFPWQNGIPAQRCLRTFCCARERSVSSSCNPVTCRVITFLQVGSMTTDSNTDICRTPSPYGSGRCVGRRAPQNAHSPPCCDSRFTDSSPRC